MDRLFPQMEVEKILLPRRERSSSASLTATRTSPQFNASGSRCSSPFRGACSHTSPSPRQSRPHRPPGSTSIDSSAAFEASSADLRPGSPAPRCRTGARSTSMSSWPTFPRPCAVSFRTSGLATPRSSHSTTAVESGRSGTSRSACRRARKHSPGDRASQGRGHAVARCWHPPPRGSRLGGLGLATKGPQSDERRSLCPGTSLPAIACPRASLGLSSRSRRSVPPRAGREPVLRLSHLTEVRRSRLPKDKWGELRRLIEASSEPEDPGRSRGVH